MIKFSEISEKKIKEFAGETIFNRGYEYYSDDTVQDFEFNPEKYVFSATIHGSIGLYSIEVWSNNEYLEANCDCPFDGYPCKHIVAVLLYFINNKDTYLKDLNTQKKIETLVKNKLSALSKIELIGIITSFSKKYPSLKRELMLLLSVDKQISQKQYSQEVDKIFRKFEMANFSTYEISHELVKIIKQVETADHHLKTEILWKITDSALHELNEYGMNDEPLEKLALDSMAMLINLLNSHSDLKERRKEIRAGLKEYCDWHNCGIIDDICDAAYALSDVVKN